MFPKLSCSQCDHTTYSRWWNVNGVMGTTSRQGPLKPPICVLHAPSIYALQGSMMFGSYMIQISIHRRKGAWIFKSPLGREPSTDPKYLFYLSVQFSSVQSLSRVWLFVTPWTTACQASLSITNSWSLTKPMSIESVMPTNHLILCRPLLLLPLIFPSIRVFSNESAPSNQVAKVLEFQLQHQSFQWTPRTDLL